MTCIEFISCHKFTTTSTFCTIEAKRFFALEFNIWSLCLGRPEVKNRKKKSKNNVYVTHLEEKLSALKFAREVEIHTLALRRK